MNNLLFPKIISILQQVDFNDSDKLFHIKKLLNNYEAEEFRFKSAQSLSDLVFETADKYLNPAKESVFIPTHFKALDKIFKGFHPGELVVIGGRPGMGKTNFAVKLCLNLAQNHPCLFLTLDTTCTKLSYYFLAAQLKLSLNRLWDIVQLEESKEAIALAHERFRNLNVFVNDFSASNFPALKKHILENIQENKIKFIFIENLQSFYNARYKHARESEIAGYVRELKDLATANDVIIIVSSSLNRSVETRGGAKRPMLSDLRESGSIEEYADKVLFLYRPAYYGIQQDEEGNEVSCRMEVNVAKNNLGIQGEGTAFFNVDLKSGEYSDYDFFGEGFEFDADRLNELN